MSEPKIGIAFGGGAARGWAHIGVLQALLSAGIKPYCISGTSIGAVVGGCYAAGQLDSLEQFARSLTRRTVFGYFDINLTGSGLISGHRLGQTLMTALGETVIEDLDVPFTAVATEIGTGHEVWLSRGSLVDGLRASYAIPGIFRPVRFGGRWLFDGALVNPIPVTVCRAMGAQYVIAVNLNADLFGLGTVLADFEAKPDQNVTTDAGNLAATNGWGARKLIQRQLFGRNQDDPESPPSISTVMVDAINIVHDRIARSRLAGDPPDVLISPRLGNFGLFEFHRASELIERGAVAAERILADIEHDLKYSDASSRPPLVHTT